ncbi:hypothetical protein HY78_08225 [Rhizorhabdus wittichii DC-6]|nr:hypothetical protein HY78_08225 [Rhizorhabdus wittichii DC-6]
MSSCGRLSSSLARPGKIEVSRRPREFGGSARRPSLIILTDREREVVAGLVEGLTNKGIGGLLGISHRTVEVHRGRLMRKLGVGSLSALLDIAFSQRHNLPDISEHGCSAAVVDDQETEASARSE